MKRLLLALLLFPAILQAQTFTRRWFHTDQHMSTPIALGSNSLTDGISAAYFTDGTQKGNIAWVASELYLRASTNTAVQIATNNTAKWKFSAGGDFAQNADNGGNIVFSKAATGILRGVSTGAITFGGDTAITTGGRVVAYGDDATGADAGRLRLTSGTAANSIVDIRPGVASGTVQFRNGDGSIHTMQANGTITSTATSFGWVAKAGANTACTTTCGAGKGCVFGLDVATVAVVACNSAIADTCICTQN